jgi:hypothetical protein
MQLKRKWTCEKHQGEHGEAGHCYVNPMGEHVGLNHRKLKLWATAIVSFCFVDYYGAKDMHRLQRML